jgi:ribosomal protein L40E
MADPYQILNLHLTATPAEVQAAYARERAKLLADSPPGEEQTAQQLQAVDDAYATLIEPTRRAAYDQSASNKLALATTSQPNAIVIPSSSPNPILQQACPHCGALNPIQATMCLQCGQQVSRPCPNCSYSVLLNQTVCPRCNTFIPEYDQRRFAEGISVERKTQQERIESEIRVQTLEEGHRVRAGQGAIFWLVVFGLCIGITVLLFLSRTIR